MNTSLNDEQEMLRSTVADFGLRKVAPVSAEHDESTAFPYEIVAAMGEMGLFGLPFPEEFGGMGGDYFTLCLAIEELARFDQSVAITLEAAVSLGAMPIYRFGSDEQRREWLPGLTAGSALGALALTEPDSGSDLAATRTRARLEGDEWILNGAKAFITNSGTTISKVMTVVARSGEQAGDAQLSTFLVPTSLPGVEIGPAYSKVGWHASDTHPVTFSDVHLPSKSLLGERGRGYANVLRILDEGRIAIAALGTGVAQGCVEEAGRYAKERVAFGKSLAEHQAIAFKIARMEVRTSVARTAYYHAASRMMNGLSFKKEAAIAKLVASEAAMDNARDATQVFGGAGFMNETTVARHYRDSKILEIGEGTSEVQLMLIARDLGLGHD